MTPLPWQQRLAACFEIISYEGRQKRRAIDALDHVLCRDPLLDPAGEPVTGEQIAAWYIQMRRLPAPACQPYHRAFVEYSQTRESGMRSLDEKLIEKAIGEAHAMLARTS
ncbi:MAG TPA: hypothetical protein VGP68_13265 [Gemmataceae bacterium]|nr:hypothetical protein [Gemmataceae bacterium]